MNIIEIYNQYHLPENLQMHMLRVAACTNLILDNWTRKPIDRKAITRVSLLHDNFFIEHFHSSQDFITCR